MAKASDTNGNKNTKSTSNSTFEKVTGLGESFLSGTKEDRDDLLRGIILTAIGVGASLLLDRLLSNDDKNLKIKE